jgi:hypothetical protein
MNYPHATALLFLWTALLCQLFAGDRGLFFEQNRGQSDSFVQFIARSENGVVLFSETGIIFPRQPSSLRPDVMASARW